MTRNPKTNNSPHLARQLFEWWCRRAEIEDLLGDIDEYFQYNVEHKGLTLARLIYFQQVLSLSFSYAIRKRKRSASYSSYYYQNSMTMFKNYFKIALRNFAKQRLFTIINIAGLAMGMSVSLLILAVLSQVVQFDHFHENKDYIYRVLTDVQDSDGQRTYASTSLNVYDAFKNDYSGVKNVVRTNYSLDITAIHEQNEIELSGIYTDPSYFEVFTFDLALGNEQTALSDPHSVVLSQKIAEKLYPGKNPLGQIIHTENRGDYKVTGVLAAHPRQTHLSHEIIGSFSTLESLNTLNSVASRWEVYTRNYVYLQINEDMAASNFETSLANLSEKANDFFNDRTVRFELQAFSDISPGRNLFMDTTPFDWIMTVVLFCLGLLILTPACFNYTNLMIGRALKRAKEIGIRKVVGSTKRQIAYQFIVEAVLLTLISLIGTVLIFILIRDEFTGMVIGSETLDLSLTPRLLGWFLVFGLVAGLMAGIFPALYFSKIDPLSSLKSEVSSKKVSISTIRKSLIVVQFAISLVFVIGVGVIAKQHVDILNYNLGFNKDNVLAVPLRGIDHRLLTNEFGRLPGVSEVSLCSHLPGVEVGLNQISIKQVNNPEDSIFAYQMFVDEHLLPSLGFALKWGENLTSASPGNEFFLVNETFMRQNKVINPGRDSLRFSLGNQKGTVVGVVKDFNFMQLNMAISPLIVRYAPEQTRYALLKVNSNDILTTIDRLEEKWSSIDQNLRFESFFLDQQIEESYRSTFGLIKIFIFLGALSITISCIGLLGMVVYFTENRVKEVAVRKIMGATTIDLYRVLGGSFVKLLLIATVITTPLAYLFYDQLFVRMISKYSVGVGWLEIVGSIAILFVLGGLPILWMVTKISGINPANNLRYE